MAIDIADLAKKTKQITSEFGGDTLTISVRLNVVTPEFTSSLRGLGISDSLVKQVIAVVEKWDLLDNGTVIPLTVEAVSRIPNQLLTKILEMAIGEMNAPGDDLKKS